MSNRKNDIKSKKMVIHPDENAKARYVDWVRGKADQPDSDLLDHVSTCELCKSDILETAELLDEVEKEEKSRIRHTRLLVLRSAAAIAAVVITALLIQFLRPENDQTEMAILPDEEQPTSTDTLKPDEENNSKDLQEEMVIENSIVIQHDTIKYADNFVPNQALEVLVNARFRSDDGFTTESWPKDTVMTRSAKWEPELGLQIGTITESKTEIIILSNTGEEKFGKLLEDQKLTVDLEWEPGLYYWKILRNSEIVWMGRLKIISSSD